MKFFKKTSQLDRLYLRGNEKQLLTEHTVLREGKSSACGSDLISYIYATAKSAYKKCSRFVENSRYLLCAASNGPGDDDDGTFGDGRCIGFLSASDPEVGDDVISMPKNPRTKIICRLYKICLR